MFFASANWWWGRSIPFCLAKHRPRPLSIYLNSSNVRLHGHDFPLKSFPFFWRGETKKKKKTRKQLQLRCKIQQKRRVFDDFSTTGRAKVVTLLDYRRKKNYSDTECCDKVKKYEMFCHLRYLIKNSSQIPDKGRQRNMKNPEGGEKCDCLPTHTCMHGVWF